MLRESKTLAWGFVMAPYRLGALVRHSLYPRYEVYRGYIVFAFLYPLFSLEKKGILISCQSLSVVRPSVRPSVRPCVRPSVTFLVNVSPSKPLEVATLNFVVE